MRTTIAKDSVRLVVAGVVSQSFALLLLLLFVGKLYDQAEMGILSSMLTLSGLLAVGASGRYEQAVVMAQDETALLLASGARRISTVFSLSLIPILFLLKPLFARSSGYSHVLPYLLWIPLLVWLSAQLAILLAEANQRKSYAKMGRSQLSQSLVNNGLKVGLGYAGASIWGLILSTILGYAAAILPLAPWRGWAQRKRLTSQRRRIALKAYSKFPRYGLWQAGVDVLRGSLLLLLLPFVYEIEYVGLVAMAAMVSKSPMQLISNSFSQVYYRHFSDCIAGRKSIRGSWRKYILRSLLLAFPLGVALYFAMPFLVSLIGVKWMEMVPVLRWMLPLLTINFLTATFNFLPDLFGLQKQHFRAEVTIVLFEVLVIWIGSSLCPFSTFIAWYFPLSALGLAAYFTWFYRIVHRYEQSLDP